ncbi:MAG TPA: hypothetical protein DER01_22065 [Phycisphaerales bacterium]|nr:hypothetical protein [Phycisphaerales bacterium]
MRIITCVVLLTVSCITSMAVAMPAAPILTQTVEVINGGTVVGSGSTYQEAYKDAKNRLPAGKSAKSVRTWKSGKTWYCEMTY